MQNINIQVNKETLHHVFSEHDKRDFTIDCILEGTMCTVKADCPTSPKVFLIQNGPFYILGGETKKSSADNLLDTIPCGAIILPSPTDWMIKLENKSELSLQRIDRFSLNHKNISIANLDGIIIAKPTQLTVEKIDASLCHKISKDDDFNYHFQNYKSESDFLNRGLGYVAMIEGAMIEGAIIGVASSALVCSSGYEISVMILPEFRGKHFGKVLAACLVRDILKRNKVPHWDAGNKESLNLATQLGYDFTAKYSAYKVQKNESYLL